MPNPTHLIVGLGNPGSEYAGTRHNIGFMAADALADKYGEGSWKKKFKSLFQKASIDGTDVLLLKPQTYMNLSGEAVQEVAQFYKLTSENIIVAHDEIDLPLEEVKFKRSGGTAGHNGLKSLDAYIGSNYARVRIGIGRPQERIDVSDYVLGHFTKTEAILVRNVVNEITKKFPSILSDKDFFAKRYKLKIESSIQIGTSSQATPVKK